MTVLPFHACVFSLFLREEKIHVAHIYKAADWKKKKQINVNLSYKVLKSNFLCLFQNKNSEYLPFSYFQICFLNELLNADTQ